MPSIGASVRFRCAVPPADAAGPAARADTTKTGTRPDGQPTLAGS
ncbi:hypothetical protein [Burkholderia sp. IT-111MI5]